MITEQMPRAWGDAPVTPLPIGTLGMATIAITSARTLYVNAQSNGMNDPSIGLTVRGVRYLVSAHLEEEVSDTASLWNYAGKTPYDKRMHLYISRADWRKHDAVSESARQVIAEMVLAAVQRWAMAHRPLLLDGEARSVNNEILRKAEKLAEIEAEAATLREEIQALEARERLVLAEREAQG